MCPSRPAPRLRGLTGCVPCSLLQRALSHVLFLTPRLPAFFLRHRLRSHVLEIRHLDRALLRLGLGQLSEEELRAVREAPVLRRGPGALPCVTPGPVAAPPFFFPPPVQACYLRGLNSTHLGMAECRAWLEQWLRLSCKLQGEGGRAAAPACWGRGGETRFGEVSLEFGWEKAQGAAPGEWDAGCVPPERRTRVGAEGPSWRQARALQQAWGKRNGNGREIKDREQSKKPLGSSPAPRGGDREPPNPPGRG